MAQTSAEWLEGQADRASARQRAQVDTAKLLATFAAGVAATLVATALQVGTPEKLDEIATWSLGACFFAVIWIILLDRIAVADHTRILELSHLHNWDDQRLMTELRTATIKAAHSNSEVVNCVRMALALQVALSATTGTIAVLSLLF
ncbi:hypothetical protein KBX53_07690 [Micromonospora sp. M51]|uniref:hypothetical protein n=1 Tax=unclassified Micromonospora TaxID=2617518 RepID=UPI001B35F185|nr:MULTISPECIES: hypothetical protein [unclassified Micromonospora]MBQ1010830.1 hypothetical protein [Micromonospora sp. M51]MBQ1034115.1 hypothetical protein [Micromonospora sp. C97]